MLALLEKVLCASPIPRVGPGLGGHSRRLGPLVWIGSCVLLLGGCGAVPASTAPVVRVGLVAPFEGHHRPIGYDVVYAARLAVREWNGRGGVSGYRVELVALDDGGNPELTQRKASSLVIDPAVVGVIGHWLEETTTAATPAYVEAGLPLIRMGESAVWTGEPPTGFTADYQAVAPFGEQPGPRAVLAYDACNLLIEAIGKAIDADGRPTRAGVAAALGEVSHQGLSGQLRLDAGEQSVFIPIPPP